MRLLLLTHYYAPEIGPPQLRWSALVREVIAAGHEVHVIAPWPHYPLGKLLPGYTPAASGNGMETGEHGERVHRVTFRPCSGSAASSLVDQLSAAAHTVITAWSRRRQIRADVVIATAPGLPTLLAGRAVASLFRRPLVVEMRDAWPDLLRTAGRPPRARSPRSWVRQAVITGAGVTVTGVQRSADLVVATSASFTQELRRRGVRRVLTVRNAPRPLASVPELVSDTEAPGELRIVYVGTVGRAQGLDTALYALREVIDAGVDARLRVVGTGARIATAQALAQKLDLPVDFMGFVAREQIPEHYAWASTFLVMLRDWPALRFAVPSKLYEALAMGMHISCSAAGETQQIVRETGAGFTTATGDSHALAQAWIRYAAHPEAPDTASMRAWLDQHATESIAAQRYLGALQDVVEGV